MLLELWVNVCPEFHFFLGEEENQMKEMGKGGKRERLEHFWLGENEKRKEEGFFGLEDMRKRKKEKKLFLRICQFLLHISS